MTLYESKAEMLAEQRMKGGKMKTRRETREVKMEKKSLEEQLGGRGFDRQPVRREGKGREGEQ